MRQRKSIFILSLLVILLVGCDITRPQKRFRLAIPNTDYLYDRIGSHLKPFLELHGYGIEIVKVKNNLEANRMVAQGETDLALIMNHSVALTGELQENGGQLRTVLPLTTSLFFAFSKTKLPDSATIRELFGGKRIGIEILQGEAHTNLEAMIRKAQIDSAKIVEVTDNPDVIVFWGTLYGTRAQRLLADGWHPFSFKENWIQFATLNEPAHRPFTLPAVPGAPNSIRINTISSEVLLVTREGMGEKAIYELAETLFQGKLGLMHSDLMYRSINESFDRDILLFPLHEGVVSYLRRDQPTFFERYADAIALGLSVLAVLYGAIQTIRNSLARRRKEQIDRYFLEFLDIRSNKELSKAEIIRHLDELFQRAVVQMTNEKLDKSDFHILSRLIQQEMSIMNFKL